MIRLTWAAVLISLLSAIVFGGQLYEMISGGTATDKLVTYAQNQASAGSDIADAAQQFSDTADDTNEAIYGAVEQLEAAAKNTKDAVRNAQTSFHEEQRA
jgi:ABC-type transporter Mla subunit MlaD